MGLRGVFRANQSASIPKKIDTDFGTDLPSDVLSSGVSVSSEPVSVKSSKGRKWTFLGGTWGIVSNKLTATSAASSYPVVSTDAKVKDVSIELRDISNGAGASLWVTDSGNWWGVGVYQDQTSCNCSSCQDYACTGYGCTGYGCTGYGCTDSGCTSTGCTSTGCTSSGCQGYGCTGYGCKGTGCTGYSRMYIGGGQYVSYCSSYGCTGGYGCTGYGCNGGYGCTGYGCKTYGCTGYGCITSGCTSSGCTNTGCTSGYYYNYACNCQTCYPAYIRLIKSVANSVTTVTTWAVTSVVKSIRVKTKGKDIIVQSFSDANLASPIQTDSYTASEATTTTKFGLIVNPSNYDEQKSMSKIKIERNK